MSLDPKLYHKGPPSPFDTDRSGSSTSSHRPDTLENYTIDEAEEVKQILIEFGTTVFLRRATDKKCSCYSEFTKEAKQDCPHCTGTGWAYRDIKTMARKMPVADPVTRATLKATTSIGTWGAAHYVFWLPIEAVIGATDNCNDFDDLHTVTLNPCDRDAILEMQLSSDGSIKIPMNIQTVWDISMVHPNIGQGGRTKFWSCYVVERAVGK